MGETTLFQAVILAPFKHRGISSHFQFRPSDPDPLDLRWPDPGLSFDVLLHGGTLLAVVAYFWKDWGPIAQIRPDSTQGTGGNPLLANPRGNRSRRYRRKTPGIQGRVSLPKPHPDRLLLGGVGLLLTGWIAKARTPNPVGTNLEGRSLDRLLAGCGSGPGRLRAGMTMMTALFLGYRRETPPAFPSIFPRRLFSGRSS